LERYAGILSQEHPEADMARQISSPDLEGLERKIAERTAELEKANAALKAEIEERKQAEEALRQSEKLHRALFEKTEEGFILVEPIFDKEGNSDDYRMLQLNDAWERQTGLKASDLVGKRIREALPNVEPVWPATFAQVATTGNAKHFESHNADSGRWYSLHAFPYGTGQVGVVFKDITARKLAEETLDITDIKTAQEALAKSRDELELRVKERTTELEESRERFRTLAELLPETIYEFDVNGKYTYANPQGLETFGLTPDVIDRGLYLRDLMPEAEYAKAIVNIEKTLKGQMRQGSEYLFKRKDGSLFPGFVHINPVERDGKTVGFRGVLVDLTDARKAEKERLQLEEQLAQAHKMEAIGTLAGGIAHDFNNMLAVILGNAEIALDDIGNEGPRKHIQAIVKASMRSRQLVKQILTFSRRMVNEGRVVQVAPLLKETCELLRASLPSTIRIDSSIRTEPEAAIFGNPSEFEQIVLNLANNAAYAMREKGGQLSIELSSLAIAADAEKRNLRPGSYLKLTMKDTGTGMTPEVQARIFEPFFTTKPLGQAAGMGLSVVYGIVEASKGVIEVESTIGTGSAFNVLLPEHHIAAKEEQEQTFVPTGGKHILFVDDEPDIVEMVEKSLESIGYRVTSFTDPSQALDVFTRNPSAFDLIMTDQTMPNLTGVGLSKKVLTIRQDMPIILCTGYSEIVSPEKARELGIREYVMKPITRKQVGEAISRALQQEQGVKQVL
jgi:PAS domain S-box-containing protein